MEGSPSPLSFSMPIFPKILVGRGARVLRGRRGDLKEVGARDAEARNGPTLPASVRSGATRQ